VIARFKDDPRIDAWDLVNEPDNPTGPSYGHLKMKNKAEKATLLLAKVYVWAHEANRSQPVTPAPWLCNWGDPSKYSKMERIMFAESDVISLHNYAGLDDLTKCIENLKRFLRPILCTEYMARPRGSTFKPNLG
jgi:hypothetical protein